MHPKPHCLRQIFRFVAITDGDVRPSDHRRLVGAHQLLERLDITASCTGANKQYTDKADCVKQCTVNYKFKAGKDGDTSGNTIGCRTYHAGAAKTDPATHCYHAGSSGGSSL